MPLRVIKVGGSLLAWPSFPQQLNLWLAHQPKACNLLIVGGGQVVDAVRDLEGPLGLTHQQCHDAALAGMALNARLLAYALGNRGIMVSVVPADLSFARGGSDASTIASMPSLAILEPVETVRALKIDFPATWDITSDSIAAAIATALGATELVLLKSRGPVPGMASDDLVDPSFGRYASPLSRVRIVDLRSDGFATSPWPPAH